ncbi:MAG: peptidoglycan-binding protein [Acidobacteria bacterium]|nr:peptidoglycan-binding protein [Acidobacteriota bacterium]
MEPTPTYSRWIRWAMAIAVVLSLMPASWLAARQQHKPHPAQKHTIRRRVQSADKSVKRHYVRHYTRHHYIRHRYTHHNYHHYRAHRYLSALRLQPERVKQIQEALACSGYLHEEPTGRWDAATRDAMQRYQQANGFAVTGLPEAKPLMKLGLGPHPLPPGLQPPAQANAGNQSEEANAISGSPAPTKSQGQTQ